MYHLSLFFLLLLCFYAAVFDTRFRKIPDRIIFSMIFLRITGSFTGIVFFCEKEESALQGFLSAVVIAGFFIAVSFAFKQITGKTAFGGGDIKLLFAIALFFPLPVAADIVVMSLLFGALGGLVLRITLQQKSMPFAPAVFTGLFYMLLYCRSVF